MQEKEKTSFISSVEKYIEDHKIYDLFERLTKRLLIQLPDSPLDFLIEELSNPKVFRVIFVNGASESYCLEASSTIASEFGLKNISVDALLAEDVKRKGEKQARNSELMKEGLPLEDDFVNETFYKAINSVEPNYKGAVINGYPKTLQQALFVQEKGIIPEKFFILEFPEAKVLKDYENKIIEKRKDLAPEKVAERADFLTKIYLTNLQDLKRAYQSIYSSIDCSEKSKETLISILKWILMPRTKKTYPLRPPRILILRPPGIKKLARRMVDSLAESLDLEKVVISDLVQREIENRSEIGKFSLEKMAKTEQIPDDIIGSLMKTSLTQTSSKHKGWILEGFPKNALQFNKFTRINIHPHLVVILDEGEETLKGKLGKILLDPETFASYESYELGPDVRSEVQERLVSHPKYSKNLYQM